MFRFLPWIRVLDRQATLDEIFHRQRPGVLLQHHLRQSLREQGHVVGFVERSRAAGGERDALANAASICGSNASR